MSMGIRFGGSRFWPCAFSVALVILVVAAASGDLPRKLRFEPIEFRMPEVEALEFRHSCQMGESGVGDFARAEVELLQFRQPVEVCQPFIRHFGGQVDHQFPEFSQSGQVGEPVAADVSCA